MRALPILLSLFIMANAQASIPSSKQSITNRQKDIRVLLGHYPRLTISGFDLVINNSIRMEGTNIFNVKCGAEENGEPFIEFAAGRKAINRLEILSPTGFLHLNNKLYRSRLTIIPRGNECSVVNVLDLEKYLAGLLTKEMMPSWPIEALKAQAVASRSYALFQADNNHNKEYDLESTTQDQVYDGATSETAKSNQAADETKGTVLSFGSGPIKAYFHANCGGITEVPENVWGSDGGRFRPVICPYHRHPRDKTTWSLSLSRPQIEQALKKISGILPTNFFRLAHLEAGAPDPNQRLNDVVVSDVQGNSLVVTANTFRNAIGNTKIKSTSFDIKPEGSGYRLTGQGFGHGVGMCQIGARAMAESGKKFIDILRYYYPLAKIERL